VCGIVDNHDPLLLKVKTSQSKLGGQAYLQGAPIKNNPLGKNHYLSYCNRFFHQIDSFYTGGFVPHTQQILLQYLLWFRNYNQFNLKVQFCK